MDEQILSQVQATWKARNDEADRLVSAGKLQCLGNYTPIGTIATWPDSGRRFRVVDRLGTHDGPYYSGLYAHWFKCEEITPAAEILTATPATCPRDTGITGGCGMVDQPMLRDVPPATTDERFFKVVK